MSHGSKVIPLILVYGLANALLYCGLLPLWEGWDEPFHYAYVQSFSVQHEIPVLHRTQISREIRQSLLLILPSNPPAPVEHSTQPFCWPWD